MSGLHRTSDTLEARVLQLSGCSKLCVALAAFGLVVSSAAALFTYRILHEPLESVGAAVVSHLASSKCTAIARTLAGLSVARSDALNGEPGGERTQPDEHTVLGVVTPASWTLEDFHSSAISEATALKILRSLPLQSAAEGTSGTTMATTLRRAGADVLQELEEHRCTQLGYGLSPTAVRVYAIDAPAGAHRHGGETESSWLVFLYGPWQAGSERKTAFALVDLHGSTMEISGHDPNLREFFPAGGGKLRMDIGVSPPSVLRNQLSLHRSMPGLDTEDQKLLGLRIVPFANQVVTTQIGIDHDLLDRLSRRSSAFVFLMGLLATAAVVLVSRSAEVTQRRLNQALLEESRTDGLTRVANRRAWDEVLSMEEGRRQRYGHSYGLVVVDLDGFKQINDQQGHQVGDQVLQTAAAQLADQLRSTDLLARVGGDEFALLIFNPSAAGLDELRERLSEALLKSGIQASIGSALSEPQATLEQTWAKADASMYAVKTAAPTPTAS